MVRPGPRSLPSTVEAQFWDLIRTGLGVEEAVEVMGVSPTPLRRWFRHRGGVKPPIGYGHPSRYLTIDDREDIAVYRGQGLGVREIAARLNRSPSTIRRELRRAARAPENVRPSVLPIDPGSPRKTLMRSDIATGTGSWVSILPCAVKSRHDWP